VSNTEAVRGGYVHLGAGDDEARVYYEECGEGPALLCLHTAGADSRQWRHLLADEEITSHRRVVAFDLPWHGRSLPPGRWWEREYRLTTGEYARRTLQLAEALELTRPTVVGCSVGGATVLDLAWHHAAEIGGAIAVEAAAKIVGRFSDLSIRPDVNGAEFVASWTYGLMAPQSPEALRREVWWIYAQGGPGVYRGDTWAWSEDWDLRGHEGEVDTARCPLWILCGEYDYVCTPEAALATAEAIPGAEAAVMADLGHFPMSEDYGRFRPYLLKALDDIAARSGRPS